MPCELAKQTVDWLIALVAFPNFPNRFLACRFLGDDLHAGTSHITYRSSRLQSLTTVPDPPPTKIGHCILVPNNFPIQADRSNPEEHSPRIAEASRISELLNSASLQPCCSQAHLANLLGTLFVKSRYGDLLHPHWGQDGK